MRLPALAAQLQGFAHSADNVNVGVSLRKVPTIPASLGSLIPTYLLLLFFNGAGGSLQFLILHYLVEITGRGEAFYPDGLEIVLHLD